MKKTVTSSEMRQLDRAAIERFGIPGIVLMENAGRAVADAIDGFLASFPSSDGTIAFLCGSGNNGGDGLVAARHLFNRGRPVEILLLKPAESFKGDALTNYVIADRMGLRISAFDPSCPLSKYLLIVDGLLGTGFSGAPSAPYRRAIELVNAANVPVIAIDLPSGLDADTGAAPGAAVEADLTVTMAAPKAGMLLPQAARYVGKLSVAEISIPRTLLER